jgi:hypothetical protein
MFAYCTREYGYIGFAEKKPRGAIPIARHADADLLRKAVETYAWNYIACRGSKRSEGIGVPWFTTAQYPDVEDEYVARFAERVQSYLGGKPVTFDEASELKD